MFKITPVQSPEIAAEYAKKCNVKIVPGSFIYAMTDAQTNALMAISQFEILSEFGYIYNIASAPDLDDFEAMFILSRQTMNFIDLCGAHICKISRDAAEEHLIKAIGFNKINDEFICDMNGMFDGSHCSGHH
jgi:hypothetical protein